MNRTIDSLLTPDIGLPAYCKNEYILMIPGILKILTVPIIEKDIPSFSFTN